MNDNAPLTPATAPDAPPALATATPWDAGASPGATAQPMEASPWDAPAAPANDPSADPWSAASTVQPDAAYGAASTSPDWLAAPDHTASAAHALQDAASPDALASADPSALQQLLDGTLPIEAWINQGLGWVVEHFRPFFQSVRAPIDGTLAWVEGLLTSLPAAALITLLGLLAWQFAGRALALGTVVSLALVALLGIWPEAMVTLSLVLTSLVFCIAIGLPLGIALAASDRAQRWVRPLLDAMQTTPAFVYLVPVVMLFGIGNVPGVIVTIVFALPPLVRLTTLGIRQVRPDLVEAARSYGASPWQLLTKVQLPLAMPSIMAGINQALMLSLSMVVIASMIAVGGLGQMVLRGIGRLDMGLATVGGLGIVLLAISLDRLTQAMGRPRRGGQRWWHGGPVGLALRTLQRAVAPSASRGTEEAVPTLSTQTR
jgi:glycine betaine/proline transport system permease protein